MEEGQRKKEVEEEKTKVEEEAKLAAHDDAAEDAEESQVSPVLYLDL